MVIMVTYVYDIQVLLNVILLLAGGYLSTRKEPADTTVQTKVNSLLLWSENILRNYYGNYILYSVRDQPYEVFYCYYLFNVIYLRHLKN